MDADDALLERLNRDARAGGVTEALFGRPVADPYRALEADTPETRGWIEAQTTRTLTALEALASPARTARLEALFGLGIITAPALGGDRVFFRRREGRREQPALFVAQDGKVRPEPLIDPTQLGERVALDWYVPSPGGRYVAHGLSDNGDERSTLWIKDVDTGAVLPESIPRTKWSRVSWLHSERGFYYTRYPAPGEPGHDPDHPDTYFPRLFWHELGTDPATDPLVFAGAQGTDFPGAEVARDDRWVVINVFRGWSASDVYLLDRRTSGPARAIVSGRDEQTTGRVHDERLYLLTNVDAPRYRIAAVPVAEAAGPDTWHEVVPEGPGAIQSFVLADRRIVVHSIESVASHLRTYDLDGRPQGEIELPTRGSVEALAARPDHPRVAFVWSSLFYPHRLFVHDPRGGLATVAEVASDVDTSAYALEQVTVPSADGTLVNVYLAHARGMACDGQNPVLLNGYGGFNVALLPTFTKAALYWLERGGIWAVANLRGGGEGGEAWHRAGTLENKHHVFEDFEAVIRWLSTSRWSSPSRIAITGGSNGGLLMAAMITRVPEAFAAATTYVGLYDMLRYHRFPPAELWISEYGSADEPDAFEWLHAYSPYHRLREGTAYPAVLVETADHDSRVHWGHSTKFAARLQELTASDRPVYFYLARRTGHGAGTRRADLVQRFDRGYAFLEAWLELRS